MSAPVIEAYLNFNGNCADAMRFYEKALGGTLEMMMTFAQSPDPSMCPPGAEDKVLHSSLLVGQQRILASDTGPGMTYEGMKGFGLALTYTSVDEAKRVFDTLAAGGTVGMPMAPTFWAESFGMVVDRFGTCWMLNGGPKPMGR